MISSIAPDQDLQMLGSPIQIAETLLQTTLAPPGSGVQAQLMYAQQRQDREQLFLDLEFAVQLSFGPIGWRERHHLVSITTYADQLFSLDASALESHWPIYSSQYHQIIHSFRIIPY